METKEILYDLRIKNGLSQEALAQKVFVTRQAVSRWETGETIPGTDTLKLLSELFGVSIDTLLGSSRRKICQCCGMPLEEDIISREKNGAPNEQYCKWCYADGEYIYSDLDDLIDVCVQHMRSPEHSDEEVRRYLKETLPQLDYWKRYRELGGGKAFEMLKKQLAEELNALSVEGMPPVKKLNALVGSFVNLSYRLPNGDLVRFLDDDTTYLGTQLPSLFGDGRCFGVVCNMDFLLICTYEENGENPELVLYKKR